MVRCVVFLVQALAGRSLPLELPSLGGAWGTEAGRHTEGDLRSVLVISGGTRECIRFKSLKCCGGKKGVISGAEDKVKEIL